MRWHFCNVLHVGADGRRLWQFDARNDRFSLNREETARNGEQLSPNAVSKSWGNLVQKKLNVAWLPPENVFLRVAQFPVSTPEETRSMVELQLEKLSPIPVTQALWTMHVLPETIPRAQGDKLQTIVVIVVSREAVEEFLGKLEGQGYMADRIELPMFDQLQGTRVTGDGAWVYPESRGLESRALIGWWYNGVLQNLGLLTLENGPNRIPGLKDQLMQMSWAGELEGWLTSPPKWHVVAEPRDEWEAVLREATEQPVEVVAPMPQQELAALTARRAAQGDESSNLLPAEFSNRYQQQFVDRLWLRGLLAALVVYGIVVAIFFVAVQVFSHFTDKVEARVQELAPAYTNALQQTAMLGVLKERDTLKFAGLDCWEAVAKTQTENLTLEVLNFNSGTRLSLRGNCPADKMSEVTDFFDAVRKQEKDGVPLFNTAGNEGPVTHLNPGGATLSWSFDLDLKQTDNR